MPVSEEVYYFGRIKEQEIMMSKAELRKTHKPIMEKRRRARINQCLNEIKSLILEAMNKDPARHSKLEKADILEMAVKHLQSVQRQQLALAMTTDSSVLRKFKNGFHECTNEIDKYIEEMDIADSGLKERMTSHLHKCITGIDQVAHMSFPGLSNLAFMSSSMAAPSSSTAPEQQQPSGDQNNNGRPSMQIPQSIQLIPSRLSSGEIALLLPNSSNLPFLSVNNEQRSRPSAFVTVVPSSSATKEESNNPPPSPQKPYSSLSPQGFRPIQLTKFTPSSYEAHQVPQVSSTSVIQNDIKPLKYPIHVYSEKDRRVLSPKKTVEPLCIITNQQERYKQAHAREDSVAFEENRFQNVKAFQSQGLLVTVPPSGQDYRPTSAIKTAGVDVVPSHAVETPSEQKIQQDVGASCSKSNDEANSDMWRPW